MRSKTKLASTLAIAMLAGACASPVVYDKPGADRLSFEKDTFECRKDAYSSGGAAYLGFGVTERTPNMDMFHHCMRARGWQAQTKGAARATEPPKDSSTPAS